jgi:Flp pilus assembly pilin Flp
MTTLARLLQDEGRVCPVECGIVAVILGVMAVAVLAG